MQRKLSRVSSEWIPVSLFSFVPTELQADLFNRNRFRKIKRNLLSIGYHLQATEKVTTESRSELSLLLSHLQRS